MTSTASKRRKVSMPGGIRQKLTAALCMLLVASIMMVSSTYAWFTLSTAPEVKGITTNVGANGNLEIVLLNAASKASTADDLGIVSEVGDSSAVLGAKDANVKWGNIVDLSDASYGLSNMTLLPARASIGDDKVVGASPLYGPSYGYDGRVSDINKTVALGMYSDTDKRFISSADAAGVSALGVSGGLSPLVSAFRTARSSATTFASSALGATRNSMSANGQALADLMIALAMHESDYAKHLDGLKAMVTGMESARDSLGNAIKQAALAGVLASKTDLTDDQVTTLVTAVGAASVADLATALGGSVPSGLDTVIVLYTTIDTQVSSASTKLNALGSTVSEAEIKSALVDLVDPDKVTVAGFHANEVKDNMGAIVAAATNGGIPIVLEAGSGVYDNMAQAVGSFTVSTRVTAEYNGIKVENMNATISSQTGAGYENKIAAFTSGLTEPTPAEGGADTKEALDDIYGYQLDFGFRTNAAGSFLKLQIDGAQRVYTDSTAGNTQGGGSYFEFSSDKLNKEELLALIHTARVLIYDVSDGNKLLAVAAADITVDETTGALSADGGTFTAAGADENGSGSWKIPLALFAYEMKDAPDNGPKMLVLGVKNTAGADPKADAAENICQLTQNVAKKISVITYFDGDQIDNSMVANDTKSMTGKLNLQFSSSATLKAMENSGLMAGGSPAKDVNAPGVTYTEYSGITSKEVTNGGTTYTVALKSGWKAYQGSDSNYYVKADSSSTYTKVNIDDYTAMLNCGAFELTEKP